MTTVQDHHDNPRESDKGAVLIMALAMIVIGALIVLPLLDYAMTVSRVGRVQTNTTVNDEAVKAGLLVALADPVSLYTVCSAEASLETETALASPPGFDVTTGCSWVDAQASEVPDSLWYSAATTQSGSTLPAGVAEANATYGASGAAIPETWWSSSSATQAGDTIWTPDLPAFDDRFQTKYKMPAAYGDCTVYFPGKYTDPLEITGPGKTFFANGIYYFTNTVKFSGNADVVVGDGLVEGCTDTPDAVLYGENTAGDGINLPAVNGGVGATFIFGDAGRLLIDNSVPTSTGSKLSVVFNKRYVQETEVSTASSAGVSIMTVNGLLNGTVIETLNNGTIAVQAPMQTGTPPTPAPGTVFKPSTLVPPDLATYTDAVVEINMTAATPVAIHIPGYVAAPQGIVKVNYAAGMTVAKDVKINGGVLGAQILVSPDRPDTDLDPASNFVIGLENPVVQQTFKITSRTVGGHPIVTGTAIVQVNQSGVAWVNSYVVQSN